VRVDGYNGPAGPARAQRADLHHLPGRAESDDIASSSIRPARTRARRCLAHDSPAAGSDGVGGEARFRSLLLRTGQRLRLPITILVLIATTTLCSRRGLEIGPR